MSDKTVEELKKEIDNMHSIDILRHWRFDRNDSPYVQGEVGRHLVNRLLDRFGGFPKFKRDLDTRGIAEVILDKDWSSRRPKEAGKYFFLGDPWRSTKEKTIGLHYVDVFPLQGKIVYSIAGTVMKNSIGYWQKIIWQNFPEEVFRRG
jgi:hypothetical protein